MILSIFKLITKGLGNIGQLIKIIKLTYKHINLSEMFTCKSDIFLLAPTILLLKGIVKELHVLPPTEVLGTSSALGASVSGSITLSITLGSFFSFLVSSFVLSVSWGLDSK